MLEKNSPLYLPPGSVRSLLALAIAGAFIAGLIQIEVVTLVLGFYFADRANGAS